MKKIEHIGIAVKDLKAANNLYSKLLNTTPYKTEKVDSENVNTSFFQIGESKIELLEGTSPDSPISKFIENRGEGVHHIAFEVDDIEKEIARLTKEGFQMIHEKPKDGLQDAAVVVERDHEMDKHGDAIAGEQVDHGFRVFVDQRRE